MDEEVNVRNLSFPEAVSASGYNPFTTFKQRMDVNEM